MLQQADPSKFVYSTVTLLGTSKREESSQLVSCVIQQAGDIVNCRVVWVISV